MTALILGGTTVPTPDDYQVELIRHRYVGPTHPGRDIDYVAVTTPAECWPVTGLFRLPRSGVRALIAFGDAAASVARPTVVETFGPVRPHLRPFRSRSGWPSWSRRWPSTATTLW